MLPQNDRVTICFAHAAYQMKATFDGLNAGIASFELRERAKLDRRAREADVIVASEMWHNGLIESGKNLKFIQSISAGPDQYDKDSIAARDIRLASLAGAAFDSADREPPVADSPFWAVPNTFLTPHAGGETRKYEANVIDILMENLERLWRGETVLRNQVV